MLSIIGLLMFATNTARSIRSIVRRMGLAVSYSSTVDLLYTVSSVASDQIHSIGHGCVSKTASFNIVYDNINQYRKSWRLSLASETVLDSSTASTRVIHSDMYPDG